MSLDETFAAFVNAQVSPALTTLVDELNALKARVAVLEQPPAPPPPTLLFEQPPALTTPTTMALPLGRNQSLTLDKTKDYILTGNVQGGLKVIGGRNIVWMNGRCTIDYVGEPAAYGGDQKLWQRARFGPTFQDFTGTVFVDGYRQDGIDGTEGIDAITSSSGTKFVLQRFRIDPLTSRAILKFVNGVPTLNPTWGSLTPYAPYTNLVSGKYWDNHSDCFQSWALPSEVVLCHGTGVSCCQFDFIEGPKTDTKVTFRRVNVRPFNFQGINYMDWVFNKGNSNNPEFSLTAEDCWADWSKSTMTYSGSSAWQAGVKLGVPPSGDFVN